MSADRKMPRLRFFEQSPGQRHITGADRYLYAPPAPQHSVQVIGTGTIGQEHMRVAHLTGRARIGGVYDDAADSVGPALEEFEKLAGYRPKAHETLEAACNSSAADALFICTPNHTHLDVLRTAMQSGKPIFLEKPMATTVADAAEILRLVANYPAFVQIGLQYRYKAPYVEARHEALERAVLGTVRTVSMCEYRPAFLDKVGQWNKFSRYSGGTLVEKCCHYFDLINLFAGARPARVFASAGQAVNFRDFEYDGQPSDIDDHAFVTVDYRNGVRGAFTLNMFSPTFHEELVLCGDAGRLVATERFDFLNAQTATSTVTIEHPEPRATRRVAVDYPALVDTSGHHGATWFEHLAFFDQLEKLPADCATPLEGFWSVVVAAAAQESAARRVVVDIEEFLAREDVAELIAEEQCA